MASITHNIALFIIFIISLSSHLQSQQPYSGLSITDCGKQHNSTSLLGYFCNGYSHSCKTFLTFYSLSPHNSVASISTFLESDPSQLSQINSVLLDSSFPTNTKVIVPVTCSCSGIYIQASSTYVVKDYETYFTIANNTFQGLSTCQAIEKENHNFSRSGYLFNGMKITVPLRCACPTTGQRRNGVKYLLSYLVEAHETVFDIGQRFGVNYTSILDANGLSETIANIYPFTTLLIPLKNQPQRSQFPKPSSSPPPPSTPTSSPPTEKKSNHTAVYVGVGVAVTLFLFVLTVTVSYFVHFRAKKGTGKITLVDDSIISENLDSPDFGPSAKSLPSNFDVGQSLKVYKFEELQLATDNFKCRIEGSVYRGVFNGDFAAVKMMNRDVSTEIGILKKINHFNLIRLSGVCFGHGHWYLVYEYAQNGSLSHWIFDQSGTKVLSMVRRVRIALDVANGLNYLHSYAYPPYVHKDIKSSNILLDGNFRGKIANFGLARPANGKEGEFTLTRHIVGTKGYMSPEYLEHGLISPKLDVYAFGILMLELITGRDAPSLQKAENGSSLRDFVSVLTEEEEEKEAREKIASFIDSSMEGNYPLDSAFFMARLIERCLRKDAASRPNMAEIVESLSKIVLYLSSVSICQ